MQIANAILCFRIRARHFAFLSNQISFYSLFDFWKEALQLHRAEQMQNLFLKKCHTSIVSNMILRNNSMAIVINEIHFYRGTYFSVSYGWNPPVTQNHARQRRVQRSFLKFILAWGNFISQMKQKLKWQFFTQLGRTYVVVLSILLQRNPYYCKMRKLMDHFISALSTTGRKVNLVLQL